MLTEFSGRRREPRQGSTLQIVMAVARTEILASPSATATAPVNTHTALEETRPLVCSDARLV